MMSKFQKLNNLFLSSIFIPVIFGAACMSNNDAIVSTVELTDSNVEQTSNVTSAVTISPKNTISPEDTNIPDASPEDTIS